MAEMLNNSELINNSSSTKSLTRRKFDKFRTKLSELFFGTSNTNVSSQSPVKQAVNSEQKNANIDNNNNMEIFAASNSSILISNCYYGYKSSYIEENLKKQQISSQDSSNIIISSSSSSSCSSSSIIIDDIENENSNCSLSLVSNIHSTSAANGQHIQYVNHNLNNKQQLNPYDTSSLNTNNFDTNFFNEQNNASNNPFLNRSFTDLIDFNTDLSLLDSYFESSLHLIDEQDNFFNIDFMVNYIAYILLCRIKNTNVLEHFKWKVKTTQTSRNSFDIDSNKSNNMLKEIARQIYLESENEPCGLKGCNMSVYLQTISEEASSVNSLLNASNNIQTHLISQFRFDSTCSLTTFELSLTLKQNSNEIKRTNETNTTPGYFNNLFASSSNNNNYNESLMQSQTNISSSIATLTRKLFATNVKATAAASASKRNKNNEYDNYEDNQINNKLIFIDSVNFDLIKTKLY